LPLALPWNLLILSSSDRIQLGRIPPSRHLENLQNWQFFLVRRLIVHV